MKELVKELKTTAAAVIVLAVILGGLYPLAVWIVSQAAFPAKANGSLAERGGQAVGSRLIGQTFSGPGYFHPRPSAAGAGYDAVRSGGSNLGPTSKRLAALVAERVAAYRAKNGLPADAAVPADAVMSSGSGLDPHISLENARLQAPRIARARRTSETEILRLIGQAAEGRTFGILGEPRVNVLLLNLSLDGAAHAGR